MMCVKITVTDNRQRPALLGGFAMRSIESTPSQAAHKKNTTIITTHINTKNTQILKDITARAERPIATHTNTKNSRKEASFSNEQSEKSSKVKSSQVKSHRTNQARQQTMVLNLKPATALVVLLTADPLSLTNADQSRRTRLLNDQKGGVAKRLALDADFHRAVEMGSSYNSTVGSHHDGLMLRGSLQTKQTASKKFADRPHIQRMLANIRRKRTLTGSVQRSVGKDKAEDQAMAEGDLVECFDDTANVDELLKDSGDADVGLLGLQADCAEGYECVPSNASSMGGVCTPTAGDDYSAALFASARFLDGYCPSGCPVEICECKEDYWYDRKACDDAFVDACLDGSYVEHCSEEFGYMTHPYQKAFGQLLCNLEVCLDGYGFLDDMTADSFCDRTDSRCEACHCILYASYCDVFGPICAQGFDASPCANIGRYCKLRADCIDDIYVGCLVDEANGIGDGTCMKEHNTPECDWDGGDCLEFNRLYPNCPVNSPRSVGDGSCHGGTYNTLECGYDGGDCMEFNMKFPDCRLVDGKHGSCATFNATYPGCKVLDPEHVGDGKYCDPGVYNTPECEWDGGDCTEFNRNYPNCKVPKPWYVGDGFCDDNEEYNIAECGWDGGDCQTGDSKEDWLKLPDFVMPPTNDCDVVTDDCPPPAWAACILDLNELRPIPPSHPHHGSTAHVYQRPATCSINRIYYHYKERFGKWQWYWTPYELDDGIWIPVSTHVIPRGNQAGQTPAVPNVAIISYLKQVNPDPRTSCGKVEGDPKKFSALTCKGIPDRSGESFEFSERVYDLSLQALYLSNLVYQENPWPICPGKKYSFTNATYDDYEFTIRGSFESPDEVDQALIAESNGRCFGIFRGTLAPLDKHNDVGKIISDWWSNLSPPGNKEVVGMCESCRGRRAFLSILQNEFWSLFAHELESCAKEYCVDPADCIVFGGHSQGGAVAEVAAHIYSRYDPWLFTFGRPNSMKDPCPTLSKLRQYNFCNTIKSEKFSPGWKGSKVLRHDPVFFVPAGALGAVGLAKAGNFGHNIFLSNEASVSTKRDVSKDLKNPLGDPASFLAAPSHGPLGGINPLFGEQSYFEHLNGLHEKRQTKAKPFPIPSSGWEDGSSCFFDEQCVSGECVYPLLKKYIPCSKLNSIDIATIVPTIDIIIDIPDVYSSECVCKPSDHDHAGGVGDW